MNYFLLWLCYVLILLNAPAVRGLQCHECLVDVNTASYIDCKLMQHIKHITCPTGSPGCAVIRNKPKGQFAQFRRECVNKNFNSKGPKAYCDEMKKNDTSSQYFNCYICQSDNCNNILLK